MKCEISVSWRDGEEELEISREKTPAELWTAPNGWRNVQQAVEVLDQTYADLRASLLAVMPEEVRAGLGVAVRMTADEARNYGGSR